MKLFQFLKSKSFLISLAAAIVISIVGVVGLLKWLKITTNHDQRIEVPSLLKLDTFQAEQVIEKNELRMVVLDTLDYDKNFPPLTVLEQDPMPGSSVKENRKIYVKINASGYGKVILPELEQLTYRQARSTIISMGLKEGTISYTTFIGKDVVLGIQQNGKKLKKGDLVVKNSKIDFVLGDGKAGLSAEQLDVAPTID
ncbi:MULTISPECIES: PASTA domain-containing protein [unclassified Myroides]|uniref:PASTA domain-containing protein n=1 Tax=unclassified Myroides TaxID=2642485 RepID=UPI0015FDF44A|nr:MULTISPECIES: PASTA domain-containing protein [unclassified Myroides]MBB1150349.1 PASTA domain-containing protein [Myroides sp. NP-2]MDM1407983.1 PASTA domain-containing protein [Myroides sp. DF42-4-2]